jgi:hypothetical protein
LSARVSASEKEQRSQNLAKNLFRGISYGFLWKFRAFALELKMLIFFSKMPLEKKDKGKTRCVLPLSLACFEIKNFD